MERDDGRLLHVTGRDVIEGEYAIMTEDGAWSVDQLTSLPLLDLPSRLAPSPGSEIDRRRSSPTSRSIPLGCEPVLWPQPSAGWTPRRRVSTSAALSTAVASSSHPEASTPLLVCLQRLNLHLRATPRSQQTRLVLERRRPTQCFQQATQPTGQQLSKSPHDRTLPLRHRRLGGRRPERPVVTHPLSLTPWLLESRDGRSDRAVLATRPSACSPSARLTGSSSRSPVWPRSRPPTDTAVALTRGLPGTSQSSLGTRSAR